MKNILISDANHGGLTLLEEYSKYTKNNLFFYDTYNKLNLDMKEFYKKKYVIDCAFYEPYRENVRGALSVLFIVMTFLACFKLFRSCIGISFSGGEGDNENDQ